ncbi:hypothetical protein PPL_06698 [Heterostelium album PN500]|uniref:Uncharacterized protein n=1 Tax=Heterostelium pallidum (strain ATCC 26659 / Pp 5 / PN500) TaxID=670386 RepID=D3BFG4_HETP5|nr:hypothetical protein PPL_06698 [Heterostelium album PN500]EFA79878.1 hypothetical protein PPL_06698 [Heterostelium album PN500]|eukprot:XP_020431999.1 hypothetical protein PPL_06698 [Heterostelium album PN500]
MYQYNLNISNIILLLGIFSIVIVTTTSAASSIKSVDAKTAIINNNNNRNGNNSVEIYFNSEIDCGEIVDRFSSNSNTSISTLAVSSISVVGDVTLFVVNNETQASSIDLASGATLELQDNTIVRATNITIDANSTLLVYEGGSLFVDNLHVDNQAPDPVSLGTWSAMTVEQSLSAPLITIGTNSMLTLTGTAKITQKLAMDPTATLVLSHFVDLYVGGASQLSEMSGTLWKDSIIQLDNTVSINNLNIQQNTSNSGSSTMSLVIEIVGEDITFGTASINNTDIYIAPNASLTVLNQCQVGPLGGISIDGYLYAEPNSNNAKTSVVVGTAGLVLKSHSSKFYAGASVNIGVLPGVNVTFITVTGDVVLEGGLYFSVDAAITPSTSINLIGAKQIEGKFEVTQVLNGGVSNRAYQTIYYEKMVTIKFNKEDAPDLALWKIFVIILGAIGGIFIGSFIIIKIVRACKSNNTADNKDNYSQLSDSSRE